MKQIRLLPYIFLFLMFGSNAKGQTYDTLSNFGSYWKYYDNATNPDSATWTQSSYNDGTWACGPSPIGYGDAWIVTCIHSGCGSSASCNPTEIGCTAVNVTAWFRQKINITNVANYDSVIIDGMVDDGLVMYVNGQNIWNYNVPTTFNSATWSTGAITGAPETTLVHNAVPITNWVTGANAVAVELHQRGPTTSDATLDLRFLFHKKGGTTHGGVGVKNVLNNADAFEVYPNPSTGNFTIESRNPNFANEPVTLVVFDVAGTKVAEQALQFNAAKAGVNLNLSAGMYFAHLVGESTNTIFRININN